MHCHCLISEHFCDLDISDFLQGKVWIEFDVNNPFSTNKRNLWTQTRSNIERVIQENILKFIFQNRNSNNSDSPFEFQIENFTENVIKMRKK